jgi:hypothetical protein
VAGKTFSSQSAFICDYKIGLVPMTTKITKHKDHCTIKIACDLTIYQTYEYQSEMAQKCDSANFAMIGLSENSGLDVAGIHFLISFQKQLQAAVEM